MFISKFMENIVMMTLEEVVRDNKSRYNLSVLSSRGSMNQYMGHVYISIIYPLIAVMMMYSNLISSKNMDTLMNPHTPWSTVLQIVAMRLMYLAGLLICGLGMVTFAVIGLLLVGAIVALPLVLYALRTVTVDAIIVLTLLAKIK